MSSDTYAASKNINAQLSNINSNGPSLSTVDSLSTLKLLSHFDNTAPANVERAQKAVTDNELGYLRAGMLGVQVRSIGDKLGRDLNGAMALAGLLKSRQADRLSNNLLDAVLEQNKTTRPVPSLQKLQEGTDVAIFNADSSDDED